MFPLNRIVAFLGPHIAWLAGAIATWLINQLGFLDLETQRSELVELIGQVLTFSVVTIVTWAGQQKWLQGHIEHEGNQTMLELQGTPLSPAGEENVENRQG